MQLPPHLQKHPLAMAMLDPTITVDHAGQLLQIKLMSLLAHLESKGIATLEGQQAEVKLHELGLWLGRMDAMVAELQHQKGPGIVTAPASALEDLEGRRG